MAKFHLPQRSIRNGIVFERQQTIYVATTGDGRQYILTVRPDTVLVEVAGVQGWQRQFTDLTRAEDYIIGIEDQRAHGEEEAYRPPMQSELEMAGSVMIPMIAPSR